MNTDKKRQTRRKYYSKNKDKIRAFQSEHYAKYYEKMRSTPESKTHPICLRLTKQQKANLVNYANELGLTITDIIKSSIFDITNPKG